MQGKKSGDALKPRFVALRSDQVADLTALAAYNVITRKGPDSVSAIVREAIDRYLPDGEWREFSLKQKKRPDRE